MYSQIVKNELKTVKGILFLCENRYFCSVICRKTMVFCISQRLWQTTIL